MVREEGGVDVEETPEGLTRQIPIIAEVLAAAGIAVVGVDDYEADDVIGTLTAKRPARSTSRPGTGTCFNSLTTRRTSGCSTPPAG